MTESITEDAPPARGGRRGPSLIDVARVAGVSEQTVSRVSRGLDNVDDSTRTRVLAAMQHVGYRPNRAARALKSGRFHNIAVIASVLSSYGSTQWVGAIALKAAQAGYSVTLVAMDSDEPHAVKHAFHSLAEHAVDGVVVLVEHDRLVNAEVTLPPGLPAVVLDSGVESQYPVIDNDQATGARIATQHLLDQGHRTVWHLAGPASSRAAHIRETAWRETLEAAGATVHAPIRGDWTPESGYSAGITLAADLGVTAVFASNDQMALGILRAMRDAGRDVPGDVSVMGFDDVPDSANYQPPLSTVHQAFDQVGEACVAVLLEEIEHGERRFPPLVPVELIVRSSTAPPPHSR